MQNPAEGRYFASIQELDDDASSNYNGLLLSVQKRQSDGFSLQGNYAISRCITDRWNSEPGVAGVPYMIPGDREADRGRCPNSPDHNVNVSVVYQIPGSGKSSAISALSSDWQVSGILAVRSGSPFTVTTGADTALTGQQNNQRAIQTLDDPYVADRTLTEWLNPAAFVRPDSGTYGTMPLDAILGPGRWNVDLSLSRSFRFGPRQFQFRWEIFNVFNTMTPNTPVSTMNSSDFGKVTSLAAGTAPRIMQLGFKFNF
jgi:hypothetical protein